MEHPSAPSFFVRGFGAIFVVSLLLSPCHYFSSAFSESSSRREVLLAVPPVVVSATAGLLSGVVPVALPLNAHAATGTTSGIQRAAPPDLTFITAPFVAGAGGSGGALRYADAKVGTGAPITAPGSSVAIDYVMSATVGRSAKIYSTADTGAPYRFQLGDGTTIRGLELAIAGGEGIEPMRPGGIRRLIIPPGLAYESLGNRSEKANKGECRDVRDIGPIPPAAEGVAGEYYQRFKNLYCNPNIPYQPDLVMDIKLYGKR